MKRILPSVGLLILLPLAVAAQTPAPRPVPPSAPVAPVVAAPIIDEFAVEQSVRAQMDSVREQARAAAAQAREVMREDRNRFTYSGEAGDAYPLGLSQMNQRQYDRAIALFDRAIAQKSPRADGALYWKAYCQFKLAKSDDAAATLAALRKDYPQSRYMADAKLLEATARRAAGQPAGPNDEADEEMKLLAMQGLMNSDADKAIPLIEGLLNASNSLAMKKKCIYVLALSDRPRAHQALLGYAKGNGTPDLQIEAIKYLATRRNQATTSTELKDIYDATQDVAVRRAIISAYQSSGNKAELLTLATAGGPVELRRSAIGGLSGLAAPQELWALYQKETDKDLRSYMVSVFSSMGATEQLTQIAKTDKDPSVRARAIRSLGNQKTDKTGQTLVELYAANPDKDTRLAIISALGSQNNADGLVGVVRKESNPELQREIIRRLADLAPKSKAAADYLEEIIKKLD